MTFDDCAWENHYSSTGYNPVPAKGGSSNGFCFSNCPSDKVRIAMEHLNTCSRKTGSRAKCCSPSYITTEKVVDPMVELWQSDLQAWLDNPTCDAGYGYDYGDLFGTIDKRAYAHGIQPRHTPRYININSPASPMEKRQLQLVFHSNQVLLVMTDIIEAYRHSTINVKALKELTVWNKIIGAKFSYLVTSQLIPFLQNVVGELATAVAEELAGRIICNLEYWNQMVRDCTAPIVSDVNMTCVNIDLDSWDPEYSIDPDTYGTSTDTESIKRSLHSLDKGDGSPQSFTIDCGIDQNTGLRRVMIITSMAYPNGGNGDNLQQANGYTVRLALANPRNCTDTSIDPNAPNNVWEWVTEHVLELQLLPRAIEFMVTGTLPGVQGLSAYNTKDPRLPWEFAELLNQDYSQWARGQTDATGVPMDRMFNSLGSKDNLRPLLNAEKYLNSMKGRVFAGKQPIGDNVWKNMNIPDLNAARAAVDELRMVGAVFEYLNGEDANRRLIDVYNVVRREWTTFQDAVNGVYGNQSFNAGILWRDFMGNFMERMSEWVNTWVNGRIAELVILWQQVEYAAPDQYTLSEARRVLGELELLGERIAACVRFDSSVFIFMQPSPTPTL